MNNEDAANVLRIMASGIELKGYKTKWIEDFKEAYEIAIKVLEKRTQGGWIPISRGLPDERAIEILANYEKNMEKLINEYISKVRCCDECFASVYCIVNGLRESRMPQNYCIKNIKRYFGDNAK